MSDFFLHLELLPRLIMLIMGDLLIKDFVTTVTSAINLAGNVGDMSATRRNVAYFRPDRPILATWFLVCRHTFVSRFPDIDGPKTDDQKERTN
jgi:hypothetical protein